MLELINISKSYKNDKILKSITYKFNDTGLYVVVGANGSGKSTLIKIISSQIFKTSGSLIRKGRVAYLPERYTFPKLMSVTSYLKNVLPFLNKNEVDTLISKYQIENRRIGELSKGNQAKVGIAHILGLKGDITIFDESFDGLDKDSIKIFKEDIINLSKNSLVIMILHNLSDIENLNPTILEVKDGVLCQ